MPDAFSRRTKLSLEATGQSLTLVTRYVTSYDDYGDPTYDETETETEGDIVFRGTPEFERRVDGIDSEVDAVAWVSDDMLLEGSYGTGGYGSDPYGGPEIWDGSESDEWGPSIVETGEHDYLVHSYFDEHNGKVRLHCIQRE